jgi:3-deoxy-manno-octulosonate cytidylyltransferase (CMP-KDO synthetase)
MDPNGVKVVVGSAGQALYFSRSLIPYPRDTAGMIDRPSRWLLHLGLYAFRPDALRAVTGEGRGAPSRLETAESLEQLRWLERGYSLGVVLTTHASMGIDTPEQYTAFVERT